MIGFIIILNLVLLCLGIFDLLRRRKENDKLRSLITSSLTTNEEIRRTLAMGLYHRFCKGSEEKSLSKLFIKQDPSMFIRFVAEVLERYYGGYTFTSSSINRLGVNFEHEREEGLYLGQVNCYENDLPFESIAILHSQMIKKDAHGGFIVNTGGFKEEAHTYAKNLNIELISGPQLVEYWINGSEETNREIRSLKSIPELS